MQWLCDNNCPDNGFPEWWDELVPHPSFELIRGGHLSRVLKHVGGPVNAVKVTADSTRCVSASTDALCVWDLATGARLQTVKMGPHVSKVFLSSDAMRAVVYDASKNLSVWDIATGTMLHELEGNREVVGELGMTPDGSRGVTYASYEDNNELQVWDFDAGTKLCQFQPLTREEAPAGSLERQLADAVITPDGMHVITCDNDDDAPSCVWVAGTGSHVHANGPPAVKLAVTPDGSRCVSTYSQSLSVWDIQTGAVLFTIESLSGCFAGATITLDASRIVVTVETAYTTDEEAAQHALEDEAAGNIPGGTTQVVDIHTGEKLLALACISEPCQRSISSDGKKCVSYDFGGKTVEVSDVDTGRLLHEFHGHTIVDGAAITPDGKRCVSYSKDVYLRVSSIE